MYILHKNNIFFRDMLHTMVKSFGKQMIKSNIVRVIGYYYKEKSEI